MRHSILIALLALGCSTPEAMSYVGQTGDPCTRPDECAGEVCVLVSSTASVCTERCDAAGACPPGWSCEDFGGERICLCDGRNETCDGTDEDCDGLIDEAAGCGVVEGVDGGAPAPMEDAAACECAPGEEQAECADGTSRGRRCTDACAWGEIEELGPCECGADERLCGGTCAACPAGDGVIETTCEADRCVASTCEAGAFACATGCCRWAVETIVAEGEVGRFPAIAFDGDDLWITHYAVEAGALLLSRPRPDGWSTEVVDDEGFVGSFSSLAIDDAGEAHLSYYRIDTGDLRYSRGRPGAWRRETVDADGDTGRFTSIALLGGAPRIAYQSASAGRLRYAQPVAEGWTHTELPSGADAGQDAALVVDGSTPHIAHRGGSVGALLYATYAGGWVYETIDDDGDAGHDVALAVCGGAPTVAYYVEDAGDLRFARRGASGWEVRTVASTGDVGADVAMVCDDDGADLFYRDVAGGRLLHRRVGLASGDGTPAVLDDSGEPGRFGVAAARAPEGELLVAYHAAGPGDLRVARLVP